MKLHADQPQAWNTITGYGTNYIEINAKPYQHSLIVLPQTTVQPWDIQHFNDLTEAHFAWMATFQPEVVVLGSGNRLRFPHPRLIAPLIHIRIGVESMDLLAACRTDNILMAEGRRVLAALLLERD